MTNEQIVQRIMKNVWPRKDQETNPFWDSIKAGLIHALNEKDRQFEIRKSKLREVLANTLPKTHCENVGCSEPCCDMCIAEAGTKKMLLLAYDREVAQY